MDSRDANQRQEQEQEDREFGERLRLAAEQAGFSKARAIAKRLDESEPNISRWWSGAVRPGREKLRRYAELTGKPLYWFYLRRGQSEITVLYDLAMQVLARAVEEGDLATALTVETGDPTLLNGRQRARLAAETPRAAARLAQIAGRPWGALTEAERRRALEQLLAEGLAGYRLDAEGPGEE